MIETHKKYAAGCYEQGDDEGNGWVHVEWSRHRTPELAERAATRYRRRMRQATGGAYSWSAWYEDDRGRIEIDSTGEHRREASS